MKTVALTFGDGVYVDWTGIFAQRFEELNGISTRVIRIEEVPPMPHGTWVKAFLWEMVPPDVERIFWFDGDCIPIGPISKFLPDESVAFAAVEDAPATRQTSEWHVPEIEDYECYYNFGVFVATRASETVFKELQTCIARPPLPFIDQTYFNVLLHQKLDRDQLGVLSPAVNWMGAFGSIQKSVRMYHLAGWPDANLKVAVLRAFAFTFSEAWKGEKADLMQKCSKAGFDFRAASEKANPFDRFQKK